MYNKSLISTYPMGFPKRGVSALSGKAKRTTQIGLESRATSRRPSAASRGLVYVMGSSFKLEEFVFKINRWNRLTSVGF
jgi:hypothetical protein